MWREDRKHMTVPSFPKSTCRYFISAVRRPLHSLVLSICRDCCMWKSAASMPSKIFAVASPRQKAIQPTLEVSTPLSRCDSCDSWKAPSRICRAMQHRALRVQGESALRICTFFKSNRFCDSLTLGLRGAKHAARDAFGRRTARGRET